MRSGNPFNVYIAWFVERWGTHFKTARFKTVREIGPEVHRLVTTTNSLGTSI